MGLYDRDYVRQRRSPGFDLGNRSIVDILIIVNVVIWAIDAVAVNFLEFSPWMVETFALRAGSLYEPWNWWQFLTFGFLHNPFTFGHILFNMLGLWFFGREMELLYGRAEFLRLYLVMIVVSGVAWSLVSLQQGLPPITPCIGASGAVMGVTALYAIHYPYRTILLNFFIPVPIWLAAIIYIGIEISGTLNPTGDGVAHGAHLAGIAFAILYYSLGWNFGRIFDTISLPGRWTPRIYQSPDEPNLDQEVDRILAKMKEFGEESLTSAERSTLERASRRYRQRRQ